MRQYDTQPAWLPPQRAFVIQLYAAVRLDASCIAGRIEHVVSGQASHFDSLEALGVFIMRVLAEVETQD